MLTEQQSREIEQQLLERRASLLETVDQRDEAVKPVELDQQLVGRLSRMDAIQQQQMASAGKSQVQAELKAITQALQRLEDGDYGYCDACDEPIAWPRLQARPTALFCITCQQEQEG